LLPVPGGEFAQFAEGVADLSQGFFHRHFLRQPVWPDLDAGRPYVVGEHNVFFRRLDVLLQLGLVDSVVIERTAQARQLHRRIGKPFFHLGALGLVERDLDAVLVRRAQLDSFEFSLGAILDDGRDIPVHREIVGDSAQPHLRFLREAGRRRGRRLFLFCFCRTGNRRRETHRGKAEGRVLDPVATI
jgi:hypothetical protein